jgi:hypothetical protein
MRSQGGPTRRWDDLGLLIAVTAGFWCLFAGISTPTAAACEMTGSAGADAGCQSDFTPQFALVSSGYAVESERHSFSPPSSAADGTSMWASRTTFLDTYQSAVAALDWPLSPQQSLFRVAPKNSPPLHRVA